VNTDCENFEGYTKHEVKIVNEVQRFQGMMGNPTEREFVGLVGEKLVISCPVSMQDVSYANSIIGSNLANLRSETTKTNPEHVHTEYVQIPWQLRKFVMLVADLMFVNGLPFLATLLRGMSLATFEFLPSQTAKQLATTLEQVFENMTKLDLLFRHHSWTWSLRNRRIYSQMSP
jgi:hypothetical protein